ncbi:hypothetical protein K439DRAFT_1622535 [Ramaria rubella]|nr:hypothetical protein K439DRAFT_1622535 [Ramaria rubella]
MASLGNVVTQWQATPSLSIIPFQTISALLTLFHHQKPRITFSQKSPWKHTPRNLPNNVHLFLIQALDVDDDIIQDAWFALKEIAWEPDRHIPAIPDMSALIPLYLEHRVFFDVTPFKLFPPTRTCLHNFCLNSPLLRNADDCEAPDLAELLRNKETLFMQAYGPLPMYATSTYCRGCNTQYYHNFLVQVNVRTFYDSMTPAIIQVSTHFFIETSAQNCTKIYNESAYMYPWQLDLPQDWPFTFHLNYELMGEAFFIHVLLNWHRDRQTILKVPHKGPTQAEWWHAAIQACNLAMAGTGQPAWNHACNLCMKHIKDASGNFIRAYRSVVTDGISLGHPCCAVHDCKELLPTNKHRYCPQHAHLSSQCAVSTCHANIEAGFCTCGHPTHHTAEQHYSDHGSAMFQLKCQNAKAHDLPHDESKAPKYTCPLPGMPPLSVDGVTYERNEHNSDTDGEEEVEVEFEEEDTEEEGEAGTICNDKPVVGHRRVHAWFCRRRTHNEELCVVSCGMILGRATFYGAEGPNSVQASLAHLFWKGLFPTKASNPAVHWFDDNCHMAAMLEADGNTHFENVTLPVDVFHFKSKHKESDGYCGHNYNPAQWGELMDEATGKWIFKLSAAEQVNGWFGGFQAMT